MFTELFLRALCQGKYPLECRQSHLPATTLLRPLLSLPQTLHEKKEYAMSRLLRIKDLVQDLIDRGATSVEEVHRQIADMPFDAIERIDVVAPTAKSVRNVHDRTVGSVYDLIRKVNAEVGRIAEDLLDGIDYVKDDDKENY
jgi:hypothetical protein